MKRKFFIKRVLRLFIVILIPSLILCSGAALLSEMAIEKQLAEQGEHIADSANINLQLTFNSIRSQTDYLTTASSMSIALKHALKRERLTWGDSIYVNMLQAMLSSMTQASTYIESVYLYLDGYSRLFDSTQGIQEVSTGDTAEWLEQYRQMDASRNEILVRRTLHRTGYGNIDVLTLCRRQLLQGGCIVINIKAEEFEEALETIAPGSQAQILMVDADGMILMDTLDEQEPTTEAELQEIMYALHNSASAKQSGRPFQDNKWVKYGANSYFITSQETIVPDLYLLSVIPDSVLKTAVIERLTPLFVLMVFILLVIVLLAYTTTRQAFSQINAIVQMLDDAEKGKSIKKPTESARDEYDLIMNNAIFLFLNTTYLNMQLKEKQYLQENAELTALQLQINPHFLFNTLQTLDIEAGNPHINVRMHNIITGVSNILKYALEDPRKSVSLAQELDILKEYAEVQHYRFGDKFILYYDVDDALLQAEVFRMMLQPLLENSLLHGLRGIPRKVYIKVRILKKTDMLTISVIDNGAGMSRVKLVELRERINNINSTSIGLTNLNRRLILRYGTSSAMQISSLEGRGTRIRFSIPLQNHLES